MSTGLQPVAPEPGEFASGWLARRAERNRLATQRQSVLDQAALVAAGIVRRDWPQARVRVFGSVARRDVRPESDLDLAIQGVPMIDPVRLWVDITDVVGEEDVDVVIYEHARPALQAAIEREGVDL